METIYALLFMMGAFIVLGIFLYQKKAKARMLAATYQMFAARDALVLLVAKDMINENDPVFSHYYERTNALIAMAPDVGIDDLLEKILRAKIKDYKKGLEEFNRKMHEIESAKSMKIADVKSAVDQCKSATVEMILSHSNFLRFYYLHFKHLRWADEFLERVTPFPLDPAVKTVQAHLAV